MFQNAPLGIRCRANVAMRREIWHTARSPDKYCSVKATRLCRSFYHFEFSDAGMESHSTPSDLFTYMCILHMA